MNQLPAQQPSCISSVKAILRILLQLILTFIVLTLVTPASYAQDHSKRNILVLNSYHKGLSWTDSIIDGIESVLKTPGQGIELFFEFMDTKRFYEDLRFQQMLEMCKTKYGRYYFDVIIACDNNAFNFAREHHRDLFPDTPVVFCGINDFDDSMLDGNDLFTGVVEETDEDSTIEVALKLHPKAKQVVVVNDRTTTGIAMKKELLEALPHFKDSVGFLFLEDFDIKELQEEVRQIASDSIILLSVVNRDRTGNFFPYEESLALIYRESKVPIYSFWEFYLGKGIVGGMLTNGFEHGKSAAEIALRILKGEDAATIPVVKKSPNRYMFDYKEMQRFGVKQSDLPKDSVIVNLPDSLYSRYKKFIAGSVAIIVVLGMIIFILLYNISLRKRVEKALRESEEKYRDLYNNAPDMYHSVNKDGIIIDCNETEARMLGYEKEEIIGKPITDFLTPESVEQHEADFPILKEMMALPSSKSEPLRGIEREFVRKDGSTFMVSLNVFSETDKDNELVRTKAIGRDITEIKRILEELKTSREQLRNLSAHLQSAEEEERKHLSREIHDELGHALTILKLDIAWLKKHISKDKDSLVHKMQTMLDLVDSTIQSVQRISAELRPGVLDYLGLSEAMQWQVGELQDRTEIEYDLVIDFDDSVLDQNDSTSIFRIFQETLMNVVRHSNATRVDAHMKENNNILELEVRDNGKGITEKQISDPMSIGLIGIQERARYIGGEAKIIGSLGKGTSVVINIPINSKEKRDID